MTQPAPPGAALPPPRTQTMYRADGTAVEVPLNQVAQAARTGSLGFGADQKVVVSDPSAGGFVQMTGAEAANFFGSSRSYGTSAATAGDYAQQQRRRELETAPQQAAAAGLGLARGLSIGLSDYAASEIGGDKVRKYLADQQRINPGLSTAGEVAGMAAPLLASGGTSGAVSVGGKAAKAATVLPRGIAALGESAGGLAKAGTIALGAAEEGRLAGAAKVLAQNAAEGALYGTGQAVSDASIKGDPLEVQKILAHTGQGAILGAALGGALHGTVALGSAGASKVAGAVRSGVSDVATAAREKLVDKITRAVTGEAGAAERVGAAELERAPLLGSFDAGVEAQGRGYAGRGGGPTRKEAPGMGGDAGAGGSRGTGTGDDGIPGFEAARQKVRDFIGAASRGDIAAMEAQGNEFVLRRAAEQLGISVEGKGPTQLAQEIANNRSVASLTTTSAKAQKNIDKLTKDARQMLPDMIERDMREIVGLDKHALMSRAEMEVAGDKLRKEAGKEMEGLLISYDKAAAGDAAKLPSLSTSTERIEREIVEPMLADVRVVMPDGSIRWKDGGTRAKIAQSLRDQTAAHVGTTSFKDMHATRKFFDEGVNFAATSTADVMKSKAFRAARNIMDEELVAAADKAVGAMGGEQALAWQSAKNRWAAANAIAENAKIGAGLDAKNRVLGLSEQLGSAKYSALGSTVGGALGSVVPVFGTAAGSAVGGVLGSLVGTHAAAYTRRYGDQLVAKVAREAGTDGVLRGAMAEVDRITDSKLGTYFGEKGVAAAAAGKKRAEDFVARAESEVATSSATREAEKEVAREERRAQQAASSMEQRIASAPPGVVRRALADKLVAVKEAGAKRIDAAKAKLSEAVAKAERIAKAAPSSAAVANEGARVGARATAARDEEYRQKRQQYADLAAAPMRLAAATDAVRQVRPDVATSLDKKLAEIVKYVNDKAPPGFAGATAFQPRGIDRVPPADARQFLKVAKAAENPLSVLDDLESGRLTTTSVQTVRDLYPDLYAEMQRKVMDKVADNAAAGKPLPYQKRLQLGVLLDVPTDASLTPQFLAASQASYAARPLAQEDAAGGGAGAPSAPKRPIKMSTSYSTRLDAMESGARE